QRSAQPGQLLVLDHSVYLTGGHGGTAWIRRAPLAADPLAGTAHRRFYSYHLDCRQNLPCGYPHARYESKLQGVGQVVYAARLIRFRRFIRVYFRRGVRAERPDALHPVFLFTLYHTWPSVLPFPLRISTSIIPRSNGSCWPCRLLSASGRFTIPTCSSISSRNANDNRFSSTPAQ